MKTAIFTIEGMRCEACASSIKNLVERAEGVRMASVSLGDRRARVLYDPRSVSEQRLVETIQEPGFRVVGRDSESEVMR